MRLLFSLILFSSYALLAQEYPEPVYTVNGKAIDGYDPVAYFTENKPVQGKEEFKLKYQGSIWYFASQKNKELFKASPAKYAPQYGGYCAWGMKNGYKAKVEPYNAWSVYNGKLYLNYNPNVQGKWVKKKDEYIATADENWPNVK